jgi:hypothetical protein
VRQLSALDIREMMKKAESEHAIRRLCHEWAKECGILHSPVNLPRFSAFKAWIVAKGYGGYLDFRSIAGPDYHAEMWFDQEFKQTWRN